GSATATALNLTVLGQSLTLGTSGAKVTSEPTATADGAGQAAPVATSAQHSAVSSTTAATDTKPNACASPDLGAQVKAVIDVGLVCSSTTASVAGALPTATGNGSVATVGMST